MVRGRLIVFEGLDRAGKSTQCEHLVKALQDQGHKVKHMRFPGTQQYHGPGKDMNTYPDYPFRQDHANRENDR